MFPSTVPTHSPSVINHPQLLQHFAEVAEAPDAIPRLRRFILDLAVRGKLVEQDPNDEPASKLIKRIKMEQATRKGIKLCWQLIINCRPHFHTSSIMQEMSTSLPHFTKRLNAFKGIGNDALGTKLRKTEALLIANLAKP
ncbi:hypothetical protein QEH59_18030 [Coraliomargarita sp. SDUM461004]|uniref:Uncharacterized protein n=1 Tax=Thalassobacterium sedimentorum TaxID=3041258 RepID=A0ABU1ANG8_9BACT|nr:hypothetical protein [Coraliomargarita sp. SDUM461004]MDQ8196340.1 hypothetical protein [Coraliomargarita sp. SDUM461004]